MLNVLTAGYGTMERFVWIQPGSNGSTSYQVIDVLPEHLKKGEIDEALFQKVINSSIYQKRQSHDTNNIPDRLSHLIQQP